MPSARDLMTSPAQCLSEGDTLVVAAQALRSQGVGSMPVKDASGGLAGMIGGLLGGQPTGGVGPGAAAPGLGSMLDLNQDGNPLDDILRMAGKALR